jgi:two-component system, NarL family, sensor histidine kinase UhpB
MKAMNILYLEDAAHDVELVERMLRKSGFLFHLMQVDNQAEFETGLATFVPDVILSDHSLYQFNSLDAIRIFKSYQLDIPFILVTGTVSEEFAVNILKEGADDYILKSNLSRLPNAITNALEKSKLEREKRLYIKEIMVNEALLKEAEHLAGFGSWKVDLMNKNVLWSEETYRIFGYNPHEVESGWRTFLNHVHNDDRARMEIAIENLPQQAESMETECRIIDNKGELKHICLKIVVKRNADNVAVQLVGFIQDITGRKEAEQKLLKSFQAVAQLEGELAQQRLNQQKLITEVTIQAQEKERNELGNELHDNINQILSTVKMYLGICNDRIEAREELLGKSYDYLNIAIEEIRKLSKTLVTPTLGDIGLAEALDELAYGINLQKTITVKMINKMSAGEKLGNNMELMLYRIVQEQLTNIQKHSKASEAVILLQKDNNIIILSVSDNGIGFDPAVKAQGIGLKNISSRVQFYSGDMKIISAPGKGCRLEIQIPI